MVKTSLCTGLVAHFDGQLVEWNLLLFFFQWIQWILLLIKLYWRWPFSLMPLACPPAHPGLGSVNYLEFCGFFLLFIFWSEQSSSRTKSACLGSLLPTYGVFLTSTENTISGIFVIQYMQYMSVECKLNWDHITIVMIVALQTALMILWCLHVREGISCRFGCWWRKINEWKIGRHHIWTFISQLKLFVLS